MKKLFILILSIVFVSCTKNIDNQIKDYIDCHCDFKNNKNCVIDLRKVLSINYDTMYLFDGYTMPESVPLIVENKTIELKGGYLYGNEKDKVIFSLNHKIVYETEWEHKSIYINENKVIEKNGIFDGDSITVSAMIYVSPIFKVIKSNNLYVLEN
jgi:hypothetical protein